VEPVVITSCQHSQCAGCLAAHSRQHGTCPQCGLPTLPVDVRPDTMRASVADAARTMLAAIRCEGVNLPKAPGDSGAPRGSRAVPTPRVTRPRPALKGKEARKIIFNEEQVSLEDKKPPYTPNVKSVPHSSNLKAGLKDMLSVGGKTPTVVLEHVDVQSYNKSRSHSPSVVPASDPEQPLATPRQPIKGERRSPVAATPKVDKRNAKGETQLHVACIKGDEASVRQILDSGANPNTRDHAGWTPLHEASQTGTEAIVRLLLEHGAVPNATSWDANVTPLHDAVTHGHEGVIRLLRSHGASAAQRDLYGRSPLDYTASCQGGAVLRSALGAPEDPVLAGRQRALPAPRSIVITASNLQATDVTLLHAFAKRHKIRVAPEFGKEVTGSTQNAGTLAPRLSRLNASRMQPGLLSGLHVFLWGDYPPPGPSRPDLEGLVLAGEGKLLHREPDPESLVPSEQTLPHHAPPPSPLHRTSHVVIYREGAGAEPKIKYNMAHLKTLPLSWLIDCVDHFRLLPPFT